MRQTLETTGEAVRDSIRAAMPDVAKYLLARHAAEWTSSTRGMLTFQYRRGAGFFVVLRSPAYGPRRLASALAPTARSAKPVDWARIREQMLDDDILSLSSAKHRYLFVRPALLRAAMSALEDTDVAVVSLGEIRF